MSFEIPPLLTNCSDAVLAHFRLQVETEELECFRQKPDELDNEHRTVVKVLERREAILAMGCDMFQVAMTDCEDCELVEVCPVKVNLDFIKNTLAK